MTVPGVKKTYLNRQTRPCKAIQNLRETCKQRHLMHRMKKIRDHGPGEPTQTLRQT